MKKKVAVLLSGLSAFPIVSTAKDLHDSFTRNEFN
jgi:hypothetical protein